MKEIGITEFKMHVLQLLAQIAQSREGFIITKRGKPLVQVLPFQSKSKKPQPGKLSHTLVFEKDIVSPLGEELWESCS